MDSDKQLRMKCFLCEMFDRRKSLLLALFPAGNYMFNVNNRNNMTRCKICSKLTIKIPERRQFQSLFFTASSGKTYAWSFAASKSSGIDL